MEVRVSNVSKLASKDVLKKLFGMVGNMIVFEHYPNIVTRDGSYECDVVFCSVREAKRAMRLDGTLLGDRSFTVKLCTNPLRYRRWSRPSERVRGLMEDINTETTTALLYDLPPPNDPNNNEDVNISEDDLIGLCGGTQVVRDCVMLDGGNNALIEFLDNSSMNLAFERLKVATLPNGSHAKICEAWKAIDPDFFPAKQEVSLLKKSSSSQTSIASRSSSERDHENLSSDRDRSRRHYDNRRSRSRSRERRHRHRSRSPHRRNDYYYSRR